MSNHDVALTVASYASYAAARRDFDVIVSASGNETSRHVALAILAKGPDGALSIDRSHASEPRGDWVARSSPQHSPSSPRRSASGSFRPW